MWGNMTHLEGHFTAYASHEPIPHVEMLRGDCDFCRFVLTQLVVEVYVPSFPVRVDTDGRVVLNEDMAFEIGMAAGAQKASPAAPKKQESKKGGGLFGKRK